jgi:hypothetical protein
MKIGKLEISKWAWSWDGRKLDNPFNILRRLICYALMITLAIPMYIVILVGWGK